MEAARIFADGKLITVVVSASRLDDDLIMTLQSCFDQNLAPRIEILVVGSFTSQAWLRFERRLLPPILTITPTGPNIFEALSRARGTFIALLQSGESYVKSDVLRRSANFLSCNPIFSFCYYASHEIETEIGRNPGMPPTLDRLLEGNFVGNSGVMYRRAKYSEAPSAYGANKFWLAHIFHARLGRIKFFDQIEINKSRSEVGTVTDPDLLSSLSGFLWLDQLFYSLRHRRRVLRQALLNHLEQVGIPVQTMKSHDVWSMINDGHNGARPIRRRFIRIARRRKRLSAAPKFFWKSILPAVDARLVVFDSTFPQAKPHGFRNAEINYYLDTDTRVSARTMFPMFPGSKAWFSHPYGMTKTQFRSNRRNYEKFYPASKRRIFYADLGRRYSVKLSYSFFLADTYALLPFLERQGIPFAFTLYPGGGFGLNNLSSDAMLKSLLQSPLFRRVFVTQTVTRDYLLAKNFCLPGQIDFIWGGVVSIIRSPAPKLRYPQDKTTFDVCFVAAKYVESGADKGFDMFVDVAYALRGNPKIRFHVVGGFGADDLSPGRDENIQYYGYRGPEFFPEFYRGMDIFLAPNRSFELFEGNFDGFPLGIDAGYCGVLLMIADELKQNCKFVDDQDLIVIKTNSVPWITKQIQFFYENPAEVYRMGERGAHVIAQTCNPAAQAESRRQIFDEIICAPQSRIEEA